MTIIRPPTEHEGSRRILVWLLALAVVLMGLSVTRQHVLGTLHLHANGGASIGASQVTQAPTAPGLANQWLSRWRQQQVFGHGQLRVGMSFNRLGGSLHSAQAPNPGHHHDGLERHHHDLGDEGVIALDGAAEAADSASPGTALWLSLFATPSASLALVAPAAANGSWPIRSAERFATLPVAPLLRPPAA